MRSLRQELLAPTLPLTDTVVVVAVTVVGVGVTLTLPATCFGPLGPLGPPLAIADGAATAPATSAPMAIVVISFLIRFPS